jgi:hypothetical protein
MTKDSDIDLLVVDPAPRNTRDESVGIRRALGDVGYPVDVIVLATERFEATKTLPRKTSGLVLSLRKFRPAHSRR